MRPSTPPDLRLLITPHVRASGDGDVEFLLRAPPGASCTVILTSSRRISSRWLGRPPRIVRLGTRHLSVPAGGEATVRFRLSADHLALLRRMQTMRVTAQVGALDARGHASRARRSFSIHAPHRAAAARRPRVDQRRSDWR